MSNGIFRTTGDVAKTVVTSLGNAPTLLVIVLLNVIMISGATYFLVQAAVAIHEERMQVLDRCLPGKEKQ